MMKMNSMTMSIVALVATFIVAAVVLMLTKMKFVLKDPNASKKEVATDKLLAYSGLIAVLVAIVVLLAGEAMGDKQKSSMSPMSSETPKYRYCGAM